MSAQEDNQDENDKSHKNAKARRAKKKESGASPAEEKKARREAAGSNPAVNLPLTEKVKRFLKGVVAESKRVSWPSKQELVAGTITTIVILFVFAGYLGGADFLLRHLTPKLGL